MPAWGIDTVDVLKIQVDRIRHLLRTYFVNLLRIVLTSYGTNFLTTKINPREGLR